MPNSVFNLLKGMNLSGRMQMSVGRSHVMLDLLAAEQLSIASMLLMLLSLR